MRGHKILLILFLVAAALPDAARAQFSPRGIMGALTLPFRAMLGRFGRFPLSHHSYAVQDTRRSAPESTQFGDVGPATWPSAYEDVVGYTFWPDRYARQLRSHGFDVIAATITGAARRGPEVARAATTGAGVQRDSSINSVDACGQGPDVRVDWPVSQIEQITQFSAAQRDGLGKLKTALAESIKTIKSGCRDTSSLPPPDRINATVQGLWAVRDAGIYIRAPLKAFYDSLSDAQKGSFEWNQPNENLHPDAKVATGDMAGQYQACAVASLQASEHLMGQIEQKIRPNIKQTASMQALRKTSTDMAKMLSASCAQRIPVDPVARLDSANDQLSSMIFAATSTEIALDALYAQLDAEQKVKFDTPACLQGRHCNFN